MFTINLTERIYKGLHNGMDRVAYSLLSAKFSGNNNYNAGIRSEELLKIGRIIGGALVLTWAIEKITDGQQ